MRILHVAEAFGGGLLEVVRLVAEGVVANGHESAIAYGTRPETPEDVRRQVAEDVALFPMPWVSRTPREQLGAARVLRATVRDYQPDVVHLHSSFAGVIGALAIDRSVPTIFTPHAFASTLPEGFALVRAGYRLAERIASRRATVVGAVSASEAQFAREAAGAHRVVVVENGIPELDANCLPAEYGERRARVVALGRTVPQRRPEACARILSSVADIAEVAWIGGGNGDRGREGRQALARAGIELTGWRPRDEVLAQLRDSFVYLHWTACDGQPLSVLEAMACDAVVVASDIAPNRDLLDRRQICRTEHEAIALIRRLVGDREFARELLDRQRETRGRYSAALMIKRWLIFYEELCFERLRNPVVPPVPVSPPRTRRFAGDAPVSPPSAEEVGRDVATA